MEFETSEFENSEFERLEFENFEFENWEFENSELKIEKWKGFFQAGVKAYDDIDDTGGGGGGHKMACHVAQNGMKILINNRLEIQAASAHYK